MKEQLRSYLGKEIFSFLEHLSESAVQAEARLYLVGGLPRDILLSGGEPRAVVLSALDVDIVVEGSVDALLEATQQNISTEYAIERLQAYSEFRTAKLDFSGVFPQGTLSVDFAEARKESYPIPGGKPQVAPGTLREDLFRRDFSVNAFAISLSDYELLDPETSLLELRSRRLKILHPASFVDDPARVIRGLRFIVRLGFVFEEETESLARSAIEQGLLASLTLGRRYSELRKSLSEQDPLRQLEMLEKWNVLTQIDKSLSFSFERYHSCLSYAETEGIKNLNFVAIASLFSETSEAEILCKNFALPKGDRKLILQIREGSL